MLKKKFAVFLLTALFVIPIAQTANAEILVVPDNDNSVYSDNNRNTTYYPPQRQPQQRTTVIYQSQQQNGWGRPQRQNQPRNIIINNYEYGRNDRNMRGRSYEKHRPHNNNSPIVVEINPFPQIKVYKRR